jgi:hypothetical protein
MIRTETPTEIQSAIAAALRQKLCLHSFTNLQPEEKRSHLEAASAFLTNPDARLTDKTSDRRFLGIVSNGRGFGSRGDRPVDC